MASAFNQFIVFKLNNNLNAILLNDVIHFFTKKDIINGNFIVFNNKTYFVENYFKLKSEEQKIVALFKNKAIILPEIEIKVFQKIIPYNRDYDFAIYEEKLVLIHRSIL